MMIEIATGITSTDGSTPHSHAFELDGNDGGETTRQVGYGSRTHFHRIVNGQVLPCDVDGHTHSLAPD